MEILKGQVRDAGYPNCECTYAKLDDNTLYYFIPDGELPNGNIIASSILKEAIGHAPYTSLGLINANGEVLIPFENKAITRIGEDLLLVEKNVPTTQSVLDALSKSADPFAAGNLVNEANAIKDQMKSVMGYSTEFIFDNLYSEAGLFNIQGQNIGGGYFSFIGRDDLGNCFMSANVLNSQIIKYDPNLVQAPAASDSAPTEQVEGGEVSNDSSAAVPQTENTSDFTPSEIPTVTEDTENNTPVDPNVPAVPSVSIPISAPDSETTDEASPEPEGDSDHSEEPSPAIELPVEEENSESVEEEQTEEVKEEDHEELNFGMDEVDSPEEESDTSLEEDASLEEDTDSQDDSFEEETEDSEENSDDDENDDSTEEEEDSFDEDETSEEENESTEEEENSDEEDDSEDEEDTSEEDTSAGGSTYEEDLEEVKNPVISNATSAIRKLLDENRKQREKIDQQSDELESLKSSHEIMKEDNRSKDQEIKSLRKSVSNYRIQTTTLTRENNKLKSTLERQADLIEHLKNHNQALKEQVAGISALGNAVAEANSLMGIDDPSLSYDSDLGYLDDQNIQEDSYQYKKAS